MRAGLERVKQNSVLVWGLPILLALYLLALHSFLLFHVFVELFSIIVGFTIFTIAFNTRKFSDNRFFLYLGVSYASVSFLDLIHTLSYKGMGIFIGITTNLPTQLWIAARYLEALSILVIFLFSFHRFEKPPLRYEFEVVAAIYVGLTTLILSLIFSGHFPTAHVEGQGLTFFKILSEFIIIAIILVTITLLYHSKEKMERSMYLLLQGALFTTIGAELAFTIYVGVFDLSNVVGHFFKLISFFLVYRALVQTSLEKPYKTLFVGLDNQRKELECQREKLVSSNKELEQYTYVVSHDLKAPLRGIITMLDWLQLDHLDQLNNEGKELINLISSRAMSLSHLIDDILTFSKVGKGREFDRVNVKTFVQHIVSNVSVPQEIDVIVEIGDGIILEINETEAFQMINNLLTNAIKFNDKEKGIVTIRGMQQDGELMLTVEDNGSGIEEKYFDKIFQMFQTLEKREDSTGVGLAIVKKVVESYNGNISVESKKGVWTRFIITLPCVETNPSESAKL